MKQIFKDKLLDHKGSDVLAREFMFALTDRLPEQLGLEKKDYYALAEIENAFYSHLPIWVDEAVQLMIREKRNGVTTPVQCLYRKPYFDPDMLSHQIMPEEMKTLDELVKARISRHDSVPKIPIGYERLPLGFFEEYHSYLISSGATEIHRLYDPPDYSRMPKGGPIWGPYSKTSIEKNLKSFFDSFPSTYFSIVKQNFPLLKDRLAPFDGATRVIAMFDVKDQYANSLEDSPGISFWHLKCGREKSLRLDLFKKGQNKDLEAKLNSMKLKRLELDGTVYEYIGGSSGRLRFIYEDLPMLGFIYSQIEWAFRRYFDIPPLLN